MGLPVFLFEMGSGQFSSEGPIGLWKICPLFQGGHNLDLMAGCDTDVKSGKAAILGPIIGCKK